MIPFSEKFFHAFARECAAQLANPNKKQLRFNEIVDTACRFYATEPLRGIYELVEACDRDKPDLYDPKMPMWRSLRDNYGWMFP